MALVSLSFILWMFGVQTAKDMWEEHWEAILWFLSVGVGMKMGSQNIKHWAETKYKSKGTSQDIEEGL